MPEKLLAVNYVHRRKGVMLFVERIATANLARGRETLRLVACFSLSCCHDYDVFFDRHVFLEHDVRVTFE